ncbi:MAG: hypothetical protein AAF462_07040 [Thermodesulfobacteriota bacterium]
MISKLRFSLIAVVMLVLLGFGFQNQAQGQVGLNGLFCPAIPHTTGILQTEIVGSGTVMPNFTGSLIGTVENSGADAVAGLDWQHVDETETRTPTPTNETGSQLVSWWTQVDGRNTYLQVTNASDNVSNEFFSGDLEVHVRIHNEDCVEIRDFCDTYTGYDTHEYNFGDLVANNGADIGDANLQGVEGWLVVTAVKDCGTSAETALAHNYLAGQLIVHDSDDYLYGVNTYARQAICDTVDMRIPVNRVPNPSFGTGAFSPWSEPGNQTNSIAEVIDPLVQLVPIEATPGNSEFSPFVAMVISADTNNGGSYTGGSFTNLEDTTLIDVGAGDDNVSILESGDITVLGAPNSDSQTLSYNLQFYGGMDDTCQSYAVVALINNATDTVVDANCYQAGGVAGDAFDNPAWGCAVIPLIANSGAGITLSGQTYDFFGRTGYELNETLSTNGTGTFTLQVITGQTSGCAAPEDSVAATVNNFILNGTNIESESCQFPDNPSEAGCLNGEDYAKLDTIRPETLYGLFNILPGNVQAGADVVHINFADVYGPPYRPVAAFSNVFVGIYDDLEDFQSCGDATVCFERLGIDDALVLSDNFNPATPTPTPPPPTTVPPTITPTTPPPTTVPPTATPTPGGGGSSSCAIAGSPVQLGTALANVLIPLVPVAFAFGVRAVRRRKK